MTRAAIIALLAGLATGPAAGQPNGQSVDLPLEYRVKAAYLLNFTRFIDWPPSAFRDPAAPISICILGKDPFGRALDATIEGEKVNSRKLVVRRIQEMPAPESCHIVYIGDRPKDLPATLASLPPGVLTVGEGEAFLRDGGMIAFVLDNRRVRFDIDQSASAKAELKLSSKLLSVARAVER